jgi:hypothetical protein
MPSRIDVDNARVGNLDITGAFDFPAGTITDSDLAASAAITRAKLAQDANQTYVVPLTDVRVWDAFHTNLPGTSAADDLALVGGTFATGSPSIQSSDLKAAGATTLYGRFMVRIPVEYDDAETVTLRFRAGMVTTVADTTATLDCEAYESDKFAGISADLVTTAAQSINSTTEADIDFALTATSLASGDWLDVRVTMAINDAATGTAVIGQIGSIELVCDVRG